MNLPAICPRCGYSTQPFMSRCAQCGFVFAAPTGYPSRPMPGAMRPPNRTLAAVILGIVLLLCGLGLYSVVRSGTTPSVNQESAPASDGPAMSNSPTPPDTNTGPAISIPPSSPGPAEPPPSPGNNSASPVPNPPSNTAPAAVGAPADAEAVIARMKRSVVLIMVRTDSGVASGTGFVVGPGLVGTCAHVIEDAQEIMIMTSDNRKLSATVGPVDSVNDVALLRCDGDLPPVVRLGGSGTGREGDSIAVTGYPEVFKMHELGFAPEASTTRGSVSAWRTRKVEGQQVQELQIDASVNHGNSGGPVYLTSDGTVIGLAAAQVADTQGLNFASPVMALQQLMDAT